MILQQFTTFVKYSLTKINVSFNLPLLESELISFRELIKRPPAEAGGFEQLIRC
jgi:hypothetical protein